MTTAELLSLIVDSTATILAAVAILLYIILWNKDKRNNSYDVFDTAYLEILKTGMENPAFRNATLTREYQNAFSDNEKIKYEIYAFISWNFCETIFDKGDEELMKTWAMVIETENSLHRNWFDHPDNRLKFKESFRQYISTILPNK
jgi:Fe-S cluster assembly ATPase SufC